MSESAPSGSASDVQDGADTLLSHEEPTSGVEPEDTESAEIQQPFNPSAIRMDVRTVSIDLLVKRLTNHEIDMAPPFQRKDGLWDDSDQSRLIESLMIRIPIPSFYFDARDDDRWVVVDGLQRLTVLKRFLVDKTLALTGLEFLTVYKDKRASDLPRSMLRRIEETQVIVYLIQPGTPEEVKFNIFQRVNRGGLPLVAQEIRHALNQGPAAELLLRLAASPEFLNATERSVSSDRMADRECVLRFLAFVHKNPKDYETSSFDGFLHQTMKELNKLPNARLEELDRRFRAAMRRAQDLLGRNAFRKVAPNGRRGPINKALLEAWSVNLDAQTAPQLARLQERKELLLDRFKAALQEPGFSDSITQGTGEPFRVKLRFERIATVIQETLAP